MKARVIFVLAMQLGCGSGAGDAEARSIAACKAACDQFLESACHGNCIAACQEPTCSAVFPASDFDGVLGIACTGNTVNFDRAIGRGTLACTVGGRSGVPDAPIGTLKRMFVTRYPFTGDLASAGGAADGLSGADMLCNKAAGGASLGGAWKAWISAGGVTGLDRIAGNGPWLNAGGYSVLFPDRASLSSGPIASVWSLNLTDEYGSAPGLYVWTGTRPPGAAKSDDCDAWTDASSKLSGDMSVTIDWQSSTGTVDSCINGHSLYCFEQ